MSPRVDTLRMSLELHATAPVNSRARPDILVLNRIAMRRRHPYPLICEQRSGFGGPGFELLAMRVVLDVADHEVREVAVLVREDIAQAVGVVDDLLRELDGGVVPVCGGRCG